MTISSLNPVDTATIDPRDTFQFLIDDTYTTVVIKVQTDVALEVAYTTAGGGAQPGYAVNLVDNGDGTHTFITGRTSGFSQDPTNIDVIEDETGSSVTTSFSYTLSATATYPQSSQPYSGTGSGIHDPNAIHDNVAGEIAAITLATPVAGDHLIFEKTSEGSAKRRADISPLLDGTDMEIAVDGVTQSVAATLLNFVAPILADETAADEFTITSRAQNHSLTSHGAVGTCELLVQFDGDATDETEDHTFTTVGTPLFGAGAMPGTKAVTNQPIAGGGHLYVTDTGTSFRKGPTDTFSVYGLVLISRRATEVFPRIFISANLTGTTEYSLYMQSDYIWYGDSGSGNNFNTGTIMPIDEWCHLGFTRDASDVVRVYLNGVEITETALGGDSPAAQGDTQFSVLGTPAGTFNCEFGYAQSVKIVDTVLGEEVFLAEARRMFGR